MSKKRKPPSSTKKLVQDTKKIFPERSVATLDGFDNFVSRLGLNNDNSLSAGEYTFNLITRNRIKLEAAYRGAWLAGAIIDSVAEDMTRAGVDVTTSEGEEDINDFMAAMSKKQIWSSLCFLIKIGRLYGGAISVLQIEGQNTGTALDPETITEGQFLGLANYDRWQLNPVVESCIKSGPEIGLPEYYQIVNNPAQGVNSAGSASMSQIVHYSRCIRFTGIDLPYNQAITEQMWGESILERLWDRMVAYDSATMSTANLIERANNRTVGIDGLREIIAAGGEAQAGLLAQFEMMRTLQTNEGLTLLDKNDTFQTTNYTFAGLSDVLLQFGQQLSGASGIPLVRLLGQSPSGLSATGDSDIRLYYDNINAQQEAKLRNPMDTLLKVLWRSTFGSEPPKDLEFTFTPLWQMSALDKATIAKTNTESVLGAAEGGMISRKTGMLELRQASGDTGLFGNITDEDIAEAEDEPPPMPDMAPENPNSESGSEAEQPKTGVSSTVKNLDSKPRWYNKLFRK